VGSEQRHAVESLLLQALIYMLKAEAWPVARDMANWRADAIAFRAQAANRFVPSMRQRLDLARIYRQARRAIPETMDKQAPLPTPEFCPMTRRAPWIDTQSHAEVGFLMGLRPPFITVPGSEKSYRPRKLRWRQISGEKWAMAAITPARILLRTTKHAAPVPGHRPACYAATLYSFPPSRWRPGWLSAWQVRVWHDYITLSSSRTVAKSST
jgi:hypothetical protein